MKVQKAKAIWDYTPKPEDENHHLCIKTGDVITVKNKINENWWIGALGDTVAMFPVDYTVVCLD